MKKLIGLALVMIAMAVFSLSQPAFAGDIVNGGKVFGANCAACHMGGNNVVMRDKTLKKDALEKYGMYDLDKIVSQVINGKNAMPSFKGKLNASEIEDVASYVLAQADKGW
ncbi:MAG: cytochrome c6 PetJ [Chroococcales cyanobacterium]